MKLISDFFAATGKLVLNFLEDVGCAVVLWVQATYLLFTPPWRVRILAKQCETIGLRSLPVVLVASTFVGMVFALHSYSGFTRFGAAEFTAPVVALAITREMGPVITALMVAGRAGAAMAAEIGTMRVTEQIDALQTLATNPVKYLVVPRLLAATIMMPTLTIFADGVGVLGGYLVGVGIMGLNSQTYIAGTWNTLLLKDIFGGLMKSMVFGFFIALICCHYGFRTRGGAEGVGRATTKSVVVSSVSVLVSDYFLTQILQWG
jgi:phospholipid/cholesterol/gamma-HCH transport system permease protein